MLPLLSSSPRGFFAAAVLAGSVGQRCVQVEWKLTRGKWRPKLLDYAKAHSKATVEAATSAAFEITSSTQSDQADLKEAMAPLTELKVGLPMFTSAMTSLDEGLRGSQLSQGWQPIAQGHRLPRRRLAASPQWSIQLSCNRSAVHLHNVETACSSLYHNKNGHTQDG